MKPHFQGPCLPKLIRSAHDFKVCSISTSGTFLSTNFIKEALTREHYKMSGNQVTKLKESAVGWVHSSIRMISG